MQSMVCAKSSSSLIEGPGRAAEESMTSAAPEARAGESEVADGEETEVVNR